MKSFNEKLGSFGVVAVALVTFGLGAPAMADDSGRARSGDIVQTANSTGQFRTLLMALETTGLKDVLHGQGPYTVFAPTDKAFGKFSAVEHAYLMDPANRQKLANLLKSHVVPGRISSDDLTKVREVTTLSGKKLRIGIASSADAFVGEDKEIRVENSQVTKTNVWAENGIIHVIDTVLSPRPF